MSVMKLVCLGDSITYGYGVKHSEAWPTIVEKTTGWEVLNAGVNGDTVGGMLVRLNMMKNLKPDSTMIFVMGGLNDVLYELNAESAKESMKLLAETVHEKGFGLMIGIPVNIGKRFAPEEWSPVLDFDGAEKAVEEYRNWLVQFCEKENIPYLDFQPGFNKSWLPDGIHPDAMGHEFMAEKLINKLK